MQTEERERYGQRVVDHFSSLPQNPYEQATTLDDVAAGLQIVRTLIKLERFQDAADAFFGDLQQALFINLEAEWEAIALLRPFFPFGWDRLPSKVDLYDAGKIANDLAASMYACDRFEDALALFCTGLQAAINQCSWREVCTRLRNVSGSLTGQGRFAGARRISGLALSLAKVSSSQEHLFMSRLFVFQIESILGRWDAADEAWCLLDPMGRVWSRLLYREGRAEQLFSLSQFWQSTLEEEHLDQAERLAKMAKNRNTQRTLHRLRGAWRLEQRNWVQAAASFQEAVRMARERRLLDSVSEAGLMLAKLHLGRLQPLRERRQSVRPGIAILHTATWPCSGAL